MDASPVRAEPVDALLDALLDAKGLNTYYGASHILRGIDFGVARSETVGLMGRNGMGKSTLLKSLMGLVKPRSGTVKVMGRDMTGSFLDASDVESRLQRWLNGFTSGNVMGSPEITARYPLQEARVEVRERRGRPGVYNCTVHLKPHHQLDDIGASFRLVTEFAPRNAAA